MEGTQSEFSGLFSKKTLKAISFRIDVSAATFKTKSIAFPEPGLSPCPSEVALAISGSVKSGIYADKDANVTLCLGGDSGPNTTDNFKADLASTNPAVQIDTAQIDSTDSVATL